MKTVVFSQLWGRVVKEIDVIVVKGHLAVAATV